VARAMHQREQPLLFPLRQVTDVELSIRERFEMFDRLNPHVFDSIVHHARNLKSQGRARYSMKGIFERIRWSWWEQVKDARDDYKLNNNYTALYARKVMEECPDLEGFFETRERRSECHS